MIMSHALTKLTKLVEVKRQLLLHTEGLTVDELSAATGVHISTVYRYLADLGATSAAGSNRYTLEPTEQDIQLAQAVIARRKQHATD